MRLIVATKNKDKFKEIKDILKGLRLQILSLNDLNTNIKIKEDGNTFFENALKKAVAVSKIFKKDLVVADDSGLEVEFLGNKPGVFSKRYAGENASYYENNSKLLKELEGVERKKRKAVFKCVVVLVKDQKLIKKFEGQLKGFISEKMMGKKGFGYDPIFYLPRYKKTVAQIPLKEKNKISHRAKAFLALKKYLAKFLNNR